MRRSMRLIAVLLVVGAVGFGASAAMGTTGSSTAGVSRSRRRCRTPRARARAPRNSSVEYSRSSSVNALDSVTLSGPNGFSHARDATRSRSARADHAAQRLVQDPGERRSRARTR